jgi:protein ImuB
MRRRQAQTECPVLELAEHDPALDARCFAPVVTALEDLTPRVEVLAPGCCVVATRGPSRYYGGDEALAELAHRTVTEALGVGASSPAGARGVGASSPASPVSVGVADGLFAAGLVGRAALIRTPSTPVLVVAPGRSAEFLSGLGLGTLAEECSLLTGCAADGTTDDLISMLWQLGMRTLGDLAALPAGDLVGRFGTQGEWMHALASGRDPRLSQPAAAHPDLSVETEIDPPADRVDTVAFAAKSLADQLDTWLAREGQALVCVEISAETEHGETSSGRWRHGFRFSPPDVVDRVRWQLDGWRNAKGRNSPTGGISLVRLRAVETLPDDGRQLGFWGGQSEADERAERALQRVQTLVGFDGVTVGRLGSGRRFADLEQRLPFGTAGPRGTGASGTAGPRGAGASGTAGASDSTPPWPGRLGAPAPAEVLAEPEPLVVLDAHDDPVGVSGRAQVSAPPAMLRRADGRTSRIASWAGPWPLEERWWSSRSRRQARFQLVLDDGTALLCAVEGGRWQREATYD